jgi:hypothetical protein
MVKVGRFPEQFHGAKEATAPGLAVLQVNRLLDEPS